VTADDVFSYRSTKDGKVFISWHGRKVTTLAGARAQRFRARADGASHEEQQLEMARVTGHFKHGNER
jgi:hypothetical protein